ncbi:LEAF RUST 10 DISEASE-RESISTANCEUS RECEPTOR-LIKE PROTEIN KINASE-like 2.1 [Typha latifolia]|uniref:LEAF RUST 10 DISEASE-RESISTANCEUS RECEPTOR-LIKE PROTEIN KINASE-like 2.1 n=1 Tax=Typha latifolia TaxID=4733 RepID=UPI003C2E1D70
MNPKLLLLFLFLLYLYLSFLSTCSSKTNSYDRYRSCAPTPYSCGDVSFTLDYPFQIAGARPEYCGHPSFHLTCYGSVILTITMNGVEYQVTEIDDADYLLTVVDRSFLGHTCPHQFHNNTIDTSLLEFTDDDAGVAVYFNCMDPSSLAGFYEISCLSDHVLEYPSFYTTYNDSFKLVSNGNCSSVSVVWLPRTAVESAEGNFSIIGAALSEGFTVRWTVGGKWCSDCVNSGGYCGYNPSSPYHPICICPNGSNRRTCNPGDFVGLPSSRSSKSNMGAIIGILAGDGSLVLLLFLLVYVLLCKKPWKKASDDEQTIKNFLQNYGSLFPKRYKYSQVKKMTKSFSQILGKGGYGTVYKGSLPDGHAVAIKILEESKGTSEDFINEVASISRTSHVNVVSLLGFCLEKSKRALIYDFMPNGSLEKFIHTDSSNSSEASLGWEKLYEIAVGIARGLEYLHRGCNTRIVHFDIKPHNILLDQDFCPKISDFGLAKLCRAKESIVSMRGMRGTPGYIAPEIFSRQFGGASSKSDTYSYGMMVLEMVAGKRGGMDAKPPRNSSTTSEVYFPQGIYEHLEQYDDEVMSESDEIVKKMILVGLWCIQTMPGDRPSMSRVVEMLEGSVRDLKMPPKPKLF